MTDGPDKSRNDRRIVIGVHDASPKFREETFAILRALDELGISNPAVHVVPDFGGRWSIAASGRDFAHLLADRCKGGCELSLHGFRHGRWEFRHLSYAEATAALQRGMELFADAFGFLPRGFVAPNWRPSTASLQAAADLGFAYAVLFTRIVYFPDRTLPITTLNFDWWGIRVLNRMSLWLNRLRVSVMKSGLLSFAIHPRDVNEGLLGRELRLLESLLESGWKPVTYEDVCECGSM